jgi:serine/threonine protein kinase
MSEEFHSCLSVLLEKDPEKRTSLLKLQSHPFFKGVNWEDVEERRNEPPLRSFLDNNDIIFRNPNDNPNIRSLVSTKDSSIKTNLFEFHNSDV